MRAVIVVCFIAAVLLLLSWIPIRCVIRIIYKDGKFTQQVYFKFGGITIRPPKGKQKEEIREKEKKQEGPSERIYHDIGTLKNIYEEIKDELFAFFELAASRGVRFQELKLQLTFGLEDAAQTGIMVGVANGFVYNILGVLDRIFQIRRIEVHIEPDFQRQFINASFGCIADTKIAHIIPIGLKGLRLYRKSIKLYKESRQIKDE